MGGRERGFQNGNRSWIASLRLSLSTSGGMLCCGGRSSPRRLSTGMRWADGRAGLFLRRWSISGCASGWTTSMMCQWNVLCRLGCRGFHPRQHRRLPLLLLLLPRQQRRFPRQQRRLPQLLLILLHHQGWSLLPRQQRRFPQLPLLPKQQSRFPQLLLLLPRTLARAALAASRSVLM